MVAAQHYAIECAHQIQGAPVQGRKAKRKVVREQESVHTGQSRDELQLYKQAVAKMKETSGMPKVGRITDLFKES